ncbi:thiamine pyrophosphate-binding protein [Cryobacterium tagatosivorans]|nr:thiamine pyrophosphate-binding protein [Cryobacterium tagatosivorans]
MVSVAEAVMSVAESHGASTAFGLLGEANLAIVLALEKRGMRWVALRREDSVVAAADGYAQGTGTVGLAIVSQGPALANAVNPLIGATKGRTPMVLLTGSLPVRSTHEPQWLDQRALVEASGIHYARVTDASSAGEVIEAAFALAVSDRRPVVLDVPTELQLEQTAEPRSGSPAEVSPPAPEPTGLDLAIEAIGRAQRPVVLAGRGAIHARDELLRLARALGAPVATTLLAKGLFDGVPNDVGVMGGFSTAHSHEVIGRSDLIVAFGAGLNQFTTERGRLLKGKHVVRVDLEATATADQTGVTGDAARVATALADALATTAPWAEPAPARDPFHDRSDESGLDLRRVSVLLDEALPRDRALTTDLGYFSSEPAVHIGLRHPSRQSFPLHFGSIGLGLASAIGLSFAHPGLPTLCVIGDGGLAASLAELETVGRLALPIVIAVFNDDAYGVEVYELQHRGEGIATAVFPPVDFRGVAEALGIRSLTVSTAADLDVARSVLADPRSPLLLDFRLKRGVMTRWYLTSVHPDFSTST